MTKKLTWRLSNLPTVEELNTLIEKKIITKEEARDVLFSSEEDVGKKNLKSEIKFLRKLIEKLSGNDTIIENIRIIERPYRRYPWYEPYNTWCGSGFSGSAGSTLTVSDASTPETYLCSSDSSDSFAGIKTFN